MISVVQIAFGAQQLELQFGLIRHFLTHPRAKDVRNAFIEKQAGNYGRGMLQYLRSNTADSLSSLVADAANDSPDLLAASYHRWLNANLSHVREFSENRLKQMEVILRFAIFESYFLKAIGNILWEYPELRQSPINQKLKIRKLDSSLVAGSLEERIAWTKAMVEAIDHLHFARWKDEPRVRGRLYVWEYLQDCLDLSFGQEQHCVGLERARRVRNHIVHRSFDLTIPDDVMDDIAKHLSNFPALLVSATAPKYPKACTLEPPEEGDDGTPGYEILDGIL